MTLSKRQKRADDEHKEARKLGERLLKTVRTSIFQSSNRRTDQPNTQQVDPLLRGEWAAIRRA